MSLGKNRLTNISRIPRPAWRALTAIPALELMVQTAEGRRWRRARKQSEIVTNLIEAHHRALRRRLKRLARTKPEHADEIGIVLEDTRRTPRPKAKPEPPPADGDDDRWAVDQPEDLERRAGLHPVDEDQFQGIGPSDLQRLLASDPEHGNDDE